MRCHRNGCDNTFEPTARGRRFCSRRCATATLHERRRPQPAAIEEVARNVRGIVAAINLATRDYYAGRYPTPPTSLEYERWVEQPRRRGIDPVWQSLLAEAFSDPKAAEVA